MKRTSATRLFTRVDTFIPIHLVPPSIVVLSGLLLLFSGGVRLLASDRDSPKRPDRHESSPSGIAPPQDEESPPEAAPGQHANAKSVWQGRVQKFGEKTLRRYEDFNYEGFYPRLDWIAPRSGPAGGARYWKPDAIGPVDVMGAAFYSWRRYQLYSFKIGMIPHRGEHIPPETLETESIEQLGDIDRSGFSKLKLYGAARYRDRTDDLFYGSGPASKRSDRRSYGVKDATGEGAVGYQFTNHFGFTVKAGYTEYSLACGRSSPNLCEFPPSPSLSGTRNPPNYFRLETSILVDFRDEVGIPHRGFMAAAGWTKWDNVNAGNEFNFNQFSTDVRGYLPLSANKHVIALRGVLIDEDPGATDRVPFFLQPTLGGSNSLRGYDTLRFQGDKAMWFQAEYRWDVFGPFGVAIFGDTGTVANRGSRLSLDKLKSDWGFGFRILGSRRVLLRVDEAFSNEGAHTQFRMAAAF
jgi:hypothetical protein